MARPVFSPRGPVRVLASLWLSWTLAACGVDGSGSGRGVLLIAVDGLRADHLSAAGYDRATSPRLDALAAEGVRFERLLSSAPQRVPAHASLLSGSDPNLARRGVPPWRAASVDQAWTLPAGAPRLALEFALAGYRTAAFVDHPDLAPVVGLDTGFQDYTPVWDPEAAEDEPGVERAGRFLRQWLADLSPREDWFAYVHLNDLERLWRRPEFLRDTYFPPRPELDAIPPVGSTEPSLFAIPPSRWIGGSFQLGQYEARYDAAVRRLDERLGRVLDDLARAGRLDDTTVCVVGTFGLQFGEAGLLLDHGRLSLADLAVPWILRPAPEVGFRPGAVIDHLASLLDVAPTLLELSGLEAPRGMFGLSHAAAVGGAAAPARERAFASCAIQGGYAAFDDDWALEVTFPMEASPELVIGWYGELPDGPRPPFELAYRYRETPFPGLDRRGPPPPELAPLAQAAVDWIARNEAIREELHERGGFLPERREGSTP